MPKVIKLKNDTYLYGTILEKGSNSNGDYIKFSDGTLICLQDFNLTVTTEYSLSGGYWGYTSSFPEFPVEFKEKPKIITTVFDNDLMAVTPYIPTSKSASSRSAYAYSLFNLTNKTFNVHVIAIGKWK